MIELVEYQNHIVFMSQKIVFGVINLVIAELSETQNYA